MGGLRRTKRWCICPKSQKARYKSQDSSQVTSLWSPHLSYYTYYLIIAAHPFLWKSLSRIWVSATPQTTARQAPRVGSHSLLQWSSQSRDQTWASCTAGRYFTIWATREAHSCCPVFREEEGIMTQTAVCEVPAGQRWDPLRQEEPRWNEGCRHYRQAGVWHSEIVKHHWNHHKEIFFFF